MNKKNLLKLIVIPAAVATIAFPLSASAKSQYASVTGNACTYCHNADYSLNTNGSAYLAAGHPQVSGWKNNPAPAPAPAPVPAPTPKPVDSHKHKKWENEKEKHSHKQAKVKHLVNNEDDEHEND